MTHINHCLSKALVTQAKEQNQALALEQLAGIRSRVKGSKRFNRMMSGWAFAQLRRFIEYKAALAGVQVLAVDPRSSSRTCSRCGERGIRDGADFSCKACGFHLHADLNAARNLCQRGISLLAGELETPLRPTASASG
jgi:IS605 OrfB family transposase